MKKTIALLLAMIFVIGLLAACTPSNTAQDPVQTNDPNAGTPAETTTPTEAPVTEPTAEGKKVYYSVLSPTIRASTSLTMSIAPLATLPPIA